MRDWHSECQGKRKQTQQLMKRIHTLISILTTLLVVQTSQAIIIGGNVSAGSGTFIKLELGFTESTPHNTVGKNTFQNSNLYAFDEAQNVAVGPDGLVPDIGSPISPGKVIASHYVFYDPNKSSSQTGSILFDSTVLAILTTGNSLANSDYLAQTSVNYLNPKLRGLEKRDSVSINSIDSKQVDVAWRASSPGDYIRVITERSLLANAVNDPTSTITLLGVGLCTLSLFRIRSKERSA